MSEKHGIKIWSSFLEINLILFATLSCLLRLQFTQNRILSPDTLIWTNSTEESRKSPPGALILKNEKII